MLLEMICSIPDSIGWAMVGFVSALCVVMAIVLGKTFVQMWREWHEDEESEVC